MAVYNVIPDRFTNLDIRDTLNAYGGSVGDNSLNYFSAAARINMWSKRKPVKRNIMFNTEDPNWFRADSGNYGINVPRAADIALLTGTYTYDIPVQGSYNLRVGDFAGYNPEATVPFTTILPSGLILASGSATVVKLMLKSLDSTYNVVPADIFPSNSYLGCAVTYGNRTLIKTLSVTIFNGGVTLNISDCELLKSDKTGVRIKVFICTSQVPSWQGETTQSYYSLNAEDGFDESTVDIVTPHADVYSFGILGLSIIEARKISLIGTAIINSGSLFQEGCLISRLDNNYYLKSVKVIATRASDGVTVAEKAQSITSSTTPTRLGNDWMAGESVNFRTPVSMPDVPALPANDYYRFTCYFRFE